MNIVLHSCILVLKGVLLDFPNKFVSIKKTIKT